MRRSRTKLVMGALVLAASAGYLGVAGAKSGWVYYVDADQFAGAAHRPGERARIHGTVGEEGLDIRREEPSARFEVMGQRAHVAVEYHGAVPEMLAAGRQVVVEGALDGRGVFVADVLLTKCASKYEGRK